MITAAGTDPRVKPLVYINALAPDTAAGETSQSIQQKFPTTDVLKHIKVVDGRIWLTKEGLPYFTAISATASRLVGATQGAPAANIFAHDAPGVAWKTKPSWYIVGTKDHTVNPDLERFLAKHMKAKTTELDSSHVPMLSQPDRVVEVNSQRCAGGVESRAEHGQRGDARPGDGGAHGRAAPDSAEFRRKRHGTVFSITPSGAETDSIPSAAGATAEPAG